MDAQTINYIYTFKLSFNHFVPISDLQNLTKGFSALESEYNDFDLSK